MKRLSLILFATGLGLALLGAAPSPAPEKLLEQGNQALRDGKFDQAIDLYEKAEPHAADPGLFTMNLALAKYARAVKNDSASDLYAAEQLYRCLLDKDDPRRAAALLGLGNCFLQKAGTRDARSVLTAIDAYEQCLQAATDAQDDKLTADAQYNLERARLLLHQIRRAEDEKQPPDKEPQNGNPPQPKDPQQQPTPNDQKNPGAPPMANSGMGESVQPQPGQKPIETNDKPPPGKGNLEPVPDKPDLPPLSAEEAKEHLKQANERIWRERHQHRIGLAKPPAADVRDW